MIEPADFAVTQECLPGFVRINDHCDFCKNQFPHSIKCNQTQALTCDITAGYYLNEGRCLACSDAFGPNSLCSGSNWFIGCQMGYWARDNIARGMAECSSCRDVDPGSLTCNYRDQYDWQNVIYTCMPGFFVVMNENPAYDYCKIEYIDGIKSYPSVITMNKMLAREPVYRYSESDTKQLKFWREIKRLTLGDFLHAWQLVDSENRMIPRHEFMEIHELIHYEDDFGPFK